MAEPNPSRGSGLIIIGCTFMAIIGVVLSHFWPSVFPYIIHTPDNGKDISIGDEFSALSAIFTLLAFVGLVGALLLQRQDLELSKREADEQKIQLNQQQDQAAKDQIRQEVFQLMDAWQEMVHHTAYKADTQGRASFSIMSGNLRSKLDIARDGQPLSKAKLREAYEGFYQGKYKDALGNYFRLLYHILRYIDHSKSVLNWKDRKQLARLIRAHLSEPEFHLLFFNCLTKHGDKTFPLVEKYDMLQNYSFDPQEVWEAEIALYKKTHARLIARRQRDAAAMLSA